MLNGLIHYCFIGRSKAQFANMSIDQNSERLEVEIEFLSIKQEHLMGLNLY